jgi:hypothetical protein
MEGRGAYRSNQQGLRADVKHDRYLHLILLEMRDMADDDALIMEHIPYIKHEKQRQSVS